jgi:error-prone DNA polymerase
MRLAVVAADYTPGEADQLRRDMAAWRKSGRIERHRERLTERMERKGIAPEFAEAVFDQIRGFGEYGFPESHAASFALIAYATAWLKCHYPVEFTCGLLNALPMGFYASSTIIEDAKRAGVEVRPIDVLSSEWECTLEPTESEFGFAVRMGLSFVKGLREDQAQRVLEERPFDSPRDFRLRVRLDAGARKRLARAGALASLEEGRREALWEMGQVADEPALPLEVSDPTPRFLPLTDLEKVGWDFRATGHSTRDHPLGPLREVLQRLGLPDARTVNGMPNRRRARYAGLVICRQRPGTAGGVTFMTLEDESGFVNVVVWQQVFDRHAVLVKTESFLGVTGKIQHEDGVVHLIADELWRPDLSTSPAHPPSRDFH